MNKTAQTEYRRLFLIERTPEPLTRASSHLQIFDNYIENTRLRLRQIRDPYTNAWTRILQQRISASEADCMVTKLAEIHLNEDEYAVFAGFEGREIRKNRYFHEFENVTFSFDVYLGGLWGLYTAMAEFDSRSQLERLVSPAFAIFEITNDSFFFGPNLVDKTFAEIRAEVTRLGSIVPTESEMPDE